LLDHFFSGFTISAAKLRIPSASFLVAIASSVFAKQPTKALLAALSVRCCLWTIKVLVVQTLQRILQNQVAEESAMLDKLILKVGLPKVKYFPE
jgi:hypothetical protein